MHSRIKMASWVAVIGGIAAALSKLAVDSEPHVTQRIIGGTEVPRGKYPFMASLRLDQKHFCGGSLYDSETVMTAAHCVRGIVDANASQFSVALGQTLLSDTVGVQQRGIRAVRISTIEGSDLAMLTLDRPVRGIAPVALPRPGSDALYRPGQTATVMGWGNIDPYRPSLSYRLLEVDVPVVSKDRCAAAYPNNHLETYFCAGTGGKDSCQGDSGGPIMQSIEGRAYQVGVVSFGAGCAQAGAPGVYADLSSAALWISLDVVWERTSGKQPPRDGQDVP